MSEVTMERWLHEGGTKDYHFVHWVTPQGRCVLLLRHGKVRHRGSVLEPHIIGSVIGLHHKLKELHKTRISHGYRMVENVTLRVSTYSGSSDEMMRYIMQSAAVKMPVLKGMIGANMGSTEGVSPEYVEPPKPMHDINPDWGLWG